MQFILACIGGLAIAVAIYTAGAVSHEIDMYNNCKRDGVAYAFTVDIKCKETK